MSGVHCWLPGSVGTERSAVVYRNQGYRGLVGGVGASWGVRELSGGVWGVRGALGLAGSAGAEGPVEV